MFFEINTLITHAQNCIDNIVKNFAAPVSNLNYEDLILVFLVYNSGEGHEVVGSHLQIYLLTSKGQKCISAHAAH